MKPFLALLPLLCVVLAGGTTPVSEGVMLVLVGAILAIAPPKYSLGWRLNAVLLALVCLAATAFLPARWWELPAWRVALVDDLQTPLPSTLSAQPWLSADALAVFLLGLSWFYLVTTAAWTSVERLRAASWFAFGTAVLSGTFVVCHRWHLAVPGWHATRDFGPFPNRNQTADFLAAGAIPALACARVAWRGRRVMAVAAWLVAWLTIAVGVFGSFSRAGVGLLFAGTLLYLLYEMGRRRSGEGVHVRGGVARHGRAVAVGLSLVLLLASAFFVAGGDTLTRVRGEIADASVDGVTSEFRLRIQRDALALIQTSPWNGVGLANFSAVFPPFRAHSAVPARAVHPESDWLWMVAELGWPSLALLLLGLVLFARRVWSPRRGPDRAIRAAAVVALLLVAAHGFVDVSMHRLGTAMCALFLAGIAYPGRGEPSAGAPALVPSLAPTVLFRILGMGFVFLGICWVQTARDRWDVPGAARVQVLTEQARAETKAAEFEQAEATASQALLLAPLDWELYFLRATDRVYRGEKNAALDDFRRVRYLEPLYGTVPYVEATLWMSSGDPDLAASALLEACRREPGKIPEFVTGVCSAAFGRPAAMRERLAILVRKVPAVELELLSQFEPPGSELVIADIITADPHLTGYTPAQLRQFLDLWSRRGDAKGLLDAVSTHREWQDLGWRAVAEAYHRLGDLPAACALMAAHAPRPSLPLEQRGAEKLSRAEVEQSAAANPGNPLFALRLYRVRQADGDVAGARSALESVLSRRDCPAYFHYLAAVSAASGGNWPSAWESWVRYLDETDTKSQ